MGRTTAGTPETPAQEKKVRHSIYQWERLSDTGEHGLMSEIYNLSAFRVLFFYYSGQETDVFEEEDLVNISHLLDRLVEDLEKGIERVTAFNVREIEAETQQAAD